jgi:phosphopantothenoylcysteine decarboxylase/phosphopantothenate--cysteine ligase
MKKSEQVLIGFALESENGLENAKKKLQSKNLDAIVLNTLEDEKAGFGVDTNLIRIIAKDDAIDQYELKPKTEVAKDILNYVEDLL